MVVLRCPNSLRRPFMNTNDVIRFDYVIDEHSYLRGRSIIAQPQHSSWTLPPGVIAQTLLLPLATPTRRRVWARD